MLTVLCAHVEAHCVGVMLCSYKLWYNYLKLRRRQVKGKCVTDIAYEEVNNAFERSLVFLHKVRDMAETWLGDGVKQL